MSTKNKEVFREIEKFNMDIVALTETKKKQKRIEGKHGYLHIYSGVPNEERARSAISLALSKKYERYIKSREQISDRVLQMDIQIKSHYLTILAEYTSNQDIIVAEKDKFWSELTMIVDKTDKPKGKNSQIFLVLPYLTFWHH